MVKYLISQLYSLKFINLDKSFNLVIEPFRGIWQKTATTSEEKDINRKFKTKLYKPSGINLL